jgi:hypothetical protein
MKIILLEAIFAAVLCLTARAQTNSDGTFRIFRLERRFGADEEWWLSPAKTKSVPRWDPHKGDAPLALKKALQIAIKWERGRDKARENVSAGASIDSISILSLHHESGPLLNFFYYRIIFIPRQFDAEACIVLMDGSVLEPTVKWPSLNDADKKQ